MKGCAGVCRWNAYPKEFCRQCIHVLKRKEVHRQSMAMIERLCQFDTGRAEEMRALSCQALWLLNCLLTECAANDATVHTTEPFLWHSLTPATRRSQLACVPAEHVREHLPGREAVDLVQ